MMYVFPSDTNTKTHKDTQTPEELGSAWSNQQKKNARER